MPHRRGHRARVVDDLKVVSGDTAVHLPLAHEGAASPRGRFFVVKAPRRAPRSRPCRARRRAPGSSRTDQNLLPRAKSRLFARVGEGRQRVDDGAKDAYGNDLRSRTSRNRPPTGAARDSTSAAHLVIMRRLLLWIWKYRQL